MHIIAFAHNLVILLTLIFFMNFRVRISNILEFTHVIVKDQQLGSVKDLPEPRDGVILLGMHRSGTSLLAGLLVKMGLQTGGPLLPPAKDNPRGFFERFDLVSQNTILMQLQHVQYAFNTQYYDAARGLRIARSNSSLFDRGKKVLAFLNDKRHHPYLLKDPRLCITLTTWLPLLDKPPVILFIYRHPLDVALSLRKREQEQFIFPIVRGLRLWYVYNRRAIQQSQLLCRVVASYHRLISNPKQEMDRIYSELRTSCALSVPHNIASKDVTYFIDPSLPHESSELTSESCRRNTYTIVPPKLLSDPTAEEVHVYRRAVSAFCAMESGDAFLSTFEWDNDMRDN